MIIFIFYIQVKNINILTYVIRKKQTKKERRKSFC